MNVKKTEKTLEEYQNLFHHHILPMQGEIYGLVLKNIPEEQEVQDVYQQIFEKCWTSLPKLQSSEHIRHWVFQIARRTIADYYKQRFRTENEIPFSAYDEDILSNEPELLINSRDTLDLLDQILAQEDMRYCRHIFCQLDSKSQAVLWLWYENGWFLNQVAEELNLNYNSVRSIFNRGIAKLRKLYQENQREDFQDEQ